MDKHDAQPERETAIFTDPHHERADARMAAMAIRTGWIKVDRWATEVSQEELEQAYPDERKMPLKVRAVLGAHKLLATGKTRAIAQADRLAVAMERQVQVDQLHALNAGSEPGQPQATTLTPEQIVVRMNQTIPLVEQTGT